MIKLATKPLETRGSDEQLVITPPANQLAGTVVIVTGSVGNLGLATAQGLQGAGAKTVLVDRSDDRLRENYPDFIDSPNHLLAGGVDLTNPDSLARMVQSACD